MFNKLISNLPFNPSLINQVSFYAKRLKEESSIRRIGFVLVALVVFLQLFAVLSPARPTQARAGNDIIPGGFTTLQEAINHCNNNDFDFKNILLRFGIPCSNLSAARTVYLRSTDRDYYSMGRLPVGPINPATGKETNEKSLTINNQTYYMRKLSSWDSGAYSTYKVLAVGNVFGVPYWILFSCGNLVQIGPPATPTPPPPTPPPPTPPPPTPPPPTPTKPCPDSKNVNDTASCLRRSKKAQNVTQNIPNANNTVAKAGDEIIYTLSVRNIGKVRHKSFVFRENMSDVLEYADIVNLYGGTINQNKVVSWAPRNIPAKTTVTHRIKIKVKTPIPSTPKSCPPTASPCPQDGSFDLIMSNTFGNTINIKVRPTVIKITETVTTKTLPNTGPGAAIALSFTLATMVGYFFARSRLMAKEVDIIVEDYSMGGGV